MEKLIEIYKHIQLEEDSDLVNNKIYEFEVHLGSMISHIKFKTKMQKELLEGNIRQLDLIKFMELGERKYQFKLIALEAFISVTGLSLIEIYSQYQLNMN
jgi:hypothetical protein